jgi:hypothetical protein
VGSAVLGSYAAFSTSGQMQMTDDGNRILRGALKDLEREVPRRVAWGSQNLRQLDAKWVVNNHTVLVDPRTRQIVETIE